MSSNLTASANSKILMLDIPKIQRDFITIEEQQELNVWTLANYQSKFFSDARMGVLGTRLTTRYFKQKSSLVFPECAHRIRDRIKTHFNIKNDLLPGYCHGIVTGIGFDGGDIYPHKDPTWHEGHYTVHCNIVTQYPEIGGITNIEGIDYKTGERDLLIYPVSEMAHAVSTIRGTTPRILWVFGFSLPRIDNLDWVITHSDEEEQRIIDDIVKLTSEMYDLDYAK